MQKNKKRKNWIYTIKIFFLIDAIAVALTVLFPKIHGAQFNTIYDYGVFLYEIDYTVARFSPTTILAIAALLVLTCFAIIVGILKKFNNDEPNMALESWGFVLANAILIPFFVLPFYDIEEMEAYIFGYGKTVYISLVMSGMVLFIMLGILGRFKRFKSPNHTKFEPKNDEDRLFQGIATSPFGFGGIFTISSRRLHIYGENMYTAKQTSVSIPYKKIVELLPPGRIFSNALKIKYIDEKGEENKMNLAIPGHGNSIKKNRAEFRAVYNFIKNMMQDANFYTKAINSKKEIDISNPIL